MHVIVSNNEIAVFIELNISKNGFVLQGCENLVDSIANIWQILYKMRHVKTSNIELSQAPSDKNNSKNCVLQPVLKLH